MGSFGLGGSVCLEHLQAVRSSIYLVFWQAGRQVVYIPSDGGPRVVSFSFGLCNIGNFFSVLYQFLVCMCGWMDWVGTWELELELEFFMIRLDVEKFGSVCLVFGGFAPLFSLFSIGGLGGSSI